MTRAVYGVNISMIYVVPSFWEPTSNGQPDNFATTEWLCLFRAVFLNYSNSKYKGYICNVARYKKCHV